MASDVPGSRNDRQNRDERDDGEGQAGVAVEEAPPAAEPTEPAVDKKKLSKKQRKLAKDAHRPLDSWERYRALTDVLDEALDLVDLADHKARFALVIMVALNVLLFFVATRSDMMEGLPGDSHVWIGGYLLVYVMVALYFFLQAIESLRPRKAQPQVRYLGETGLEEHPLGIRFYEDILSRDLDAYRRAWRDLHIGQLNNELAVQAHALAAINHAKYNALRRLYMGLKILTLMAVGLVGVAALFAFVGTAKAGKHGRKNAQVLGTPDRLATPGVQEPSGVVFHAGLGHLFVVGDEGSLGEFDVAGNSVRSHRVKGNLEDVAVHKASGSLLLLDEQRSELSLYDPVAQQMLKSWKLDRDAIVGQKVGDKNNGFEGLAFREDPGRPGGGILYLAHQRSPPILVAITVDLSGQGGTVAGESVLGRWPLPDHGDLTAVTYAHSIDRLLLVADKEDRLLVVRSDGSLETEIPLPGQQQEGLAFDTTGALWLADDQDKSLLRLDGALASIDAFLRNPAAFDNPFVPSEKPRRQSS